MARRAGVTPARCAIRLSVLFLNGVNWMVKFFMLYSLLFLFPICFALMYFSLKEITEADDLMDRIKKFASK